MAIDFPSAPSNGQEHTSGGVIYVYNGTGWVMKTTPAVPAAPFDALAYNGMQTNGSMEVSQENPLDTWTPIGIGKYIIDGWAPQSNGPQATHATQGTLISLPGFTRALTVISNPANASPTGADYVFVMHRIEGWRVARLAWGTANARPITVAFWITADLPGTYAVSVQNGTLPADRSYVASFTVNAGATWEYKTITIPGDQTGTWYKGNTTGIIVNITAMCGPTFATAAGVWTAGNKIGVTGQSNALVNINQGISITGAIVLPGIYAPTAAQSPLIMRPYDQELVTCQRYFQRFSMGIQCYVELVGENWGPGLVTFPAVMRATPTATHAANIIAANFAATIPSILFATVSSAYFYKGSTGVGNAAWSDDVFLDARL